MKKETINLIALIVLSVLMLCIPSGNPQEPNNLPTKIDTLTTKK
jgi:hypothetical protein